MFTVILIALIIHVFETSLMQQRVHFTQYIEIIELNDRHWMNRRKVICGENILPLM
jgi:hypothetical protein